MSAQAEAAKRAWRRRTPSYAADLRTAIERDAAARFTRWQTRGRLPAWLRVKRRLRNMFVRALAVARSS